MAPSKQKRKEPIQNGTLFDFFSGAAATKRARRRPPQEPATKRKENVVHDIPLSHEVIIIESDSEDDLRKVTVERTIVRLDRKTGVSRAAPTLTPSVTNQPDLSEVAITFGEPSALLQTPPPEESNGEPSASRSPKRCPQSQSMDSMFGTSALLLDKPSSNNLDSEQSQACLVQHVYPTTPSLVAQPALEEVIGDWIGGDDELAALKASGNSFDVEIEGLSLEEQRVCPVCNIDLAGVPVSEGYNHVNECLDMSMLNDNTTSNIDPQDKKSLQIPIRSDMISDEACTSTRVDGGGNLYSVLMASHKDNEAWSEVDANGIRDRKPNRGSRRKAPFYKVLQGMPIAVDAFCYGTIPSVTAYFLTHAHSDHYTNLAANWKSGPIYCSEETAKLIVHILGVDPKWVHAIPMDTSTVIPNTGGVTVTLIEANHCPGSCLFFFEGQQTINAGDSAFKSHFIGSSRIFRYLHCGDFRASPRHVLHPVVKGKHIDQIYLDTTYLDPKYTFPPQPLVIAACAELARRQVIGDDLDVPKNKDFTFDAWIKPHPAEDQERSLPQGRMLVVVGTYSIGKERVVKAIAQTLKTKIYCDPRKRAILRCQADEELHDLLTTDPAEGGVHILPLSIITADNLKTYLQRFKGTFSRVLGFRPTGWTYTPPSGSDPDPTVQAIISRSQSQYFLHTDLKATPKSSYAVQIFGVPYSEHSSFFELTCFAMSCEWGKIIPTVNVGSLSSRAKMTKWMNRWELERRHVRPSMIQPRTDDYW